MTRDRETWIAAKPPKTEHPREFWEAIADSVLGGRTSIEAAPEEVLGASMYKGVWTKEADVV